MDRTTGESQDETEANIPARSDVRVAVEQPQPPPGLKVGGITSEQVCVSCGATLGGEYCSACGERRFAHQRLRIRYYLGNTFAALTNLDGRALRSFGLLLSRPGFLTSEWLDGRRRPYLLPSQLFLVANVVYFFVLPLTGYGGYGTPLRLQMDAQLYSGVLPIAEQVDARMEDLGMEFGQFEQIFNARTSILSRSLVFALIPIFALGVAVLFPRGPAVRHLVLATHYYAFELLYLGSLFLLAFASVWPATSAAALGIGVHPEILAIISEGATGPLTMIYLYFAVRRVYGVGRTRALTSVVGLVLMQMVATQLYRLILFWVTFASV